jgi:hypothetical protein
MSRKFRLLVGALAGPALGAALWGGLLYGGMSLIGAPPTVESLFLSASIFYGAWQIVALIWLRRNWR